MINKYCTIFKTFDNDLDGIINKIGILGKSFAEIFDAINKRQLKISDIRNSNGGDLKSAKGQAGSIWSYIFPEKVIDDSLLAQFEQFKEKFNSTTLSAKALAEEMGDVDSSIIKYAKTQKNGQLTTEGFTKSLQSMTLKAKAASVGMKALAVAGNMIVFALISKGIALAITAVDNYIHRVEKASEALAEAQRKFNDSTAEVKSLSEELEKCRKRIDEINELGGAEVAKDGELEKLQEQTKELENQLALKREEQRLDAIQLAKKAEKAYDVKVASEYSFISYTNDDAYAGSTIDNRQRLTPGEEMTAAIEKYKEYAAKKEQIDSELVASQQELYKAQEAGAGIDIIDPLSKTINELEKSSSHYQSLMDNASARANEMSKLSIDIETAYKSLDELGSLSPDQESSLAYIGSLNDQYYNFLKIINDIGDATEKVSNFQQEAESLSSPIVFNIKDEGIVKEIDDYQKKFSSLASAIEKVKDQDLSGSELLDLKQEFPELINSTDDLDVALSNLVDTTLSDVVRYLETAGASDDLINVFRQLADEARGLAQINWSGTFDVFDTADSKMSSLAEFTKALGDSYTITATEARKFAEVFPELLALGQSTSSGLIQFNKSVVDDFVAGKQTEIQADRDAQIAQLEDRKAILEGKKASAQAALDLVAAYAAGEVDAENQKNSKLGEARTNLVQHLVDLGVQEVDANAAANELMAGNIQEYDRVVAEVSENVDANLTNSINDAASNVNVQSGSMVNSLFGVAKQAEYTAKAIASLASGNPIEASKYMIEGAINAAPSFKKADVIPEFNKAVQEAIDVEEYKEVDISLDLELDIDKYQKAISDIDSQIALLKASGTKSLDDYASDLEKSGSGSKGSKKEPTVFDYMQQKVDLLSAQVDKLKTNIDSLVGYKSKNSMTNTAIDVLTEKMSVLQQMHDKYMEEAGKLGLSQEYIDKIQNGSIEIESIADENLAKVIQEYQDLFEKAEFANDQIIEATQSIHELNLSKLDNIINQFEQMTDIQSQMIDTEKQLLDLREKSGEEIYMDDYISLAGKQLNLTRQNADAYNTLAAEMSKMNLKEGSDDWKKYNDQLQEYKNNMISAADAVEQYKDAMKELAYKGLGDLKSAMDSINGTISTMNDLIGDTNLIDDFGKLTDRGLAQVALYVHKMTNAKQEAAEYAKAIESLDDALDSGLITQDEYNSMLQDYTSSQESAVKSSKEARDAILSLVKEGIQAEIDAKKKLVDETKAALDAEKDLHDYQNSIAKKQDNISKLERQIAALSNSTNREDIAQRLQLQSQLADAKEELFEEQYDHEIEQRKEALDDEYESFEESKKKESDELDSNLDAQNAAINKYLEQVKANYSTVYNILTQYGNEYSLAAIKDLTDPWESGSNAADLCSNAIGDAVANIQYEINGLDFSPLYELVDLLEQIGLGGYGGGSSFAQYKDITGTGKWQKGQDDKWWFGEDYDPNGNYDYASGGIYTINGKQYGFDDEGYMQTGWNDEHGDWRYFEPENGEMVKSEWRKSSNGDWYYLDKDGVMATDMAVKAREDDGYYYLDNEGKWDGQTLSSEQIRKLGVRIGYRKGTANARKGWNLMDEDGLGSESIITDKGRLVQFKGGETVFNLEMTENLWELAQDPTKFVPGLCNISANTLDLSKIQPVQRNVEFNAPLFQVEGGLSSDMVGYIDQKCDWLKKNVGKLAYEDLENTLFGK